MAVTPEPSLCPMGVWMTEEDAMKRHDNINAKLMRLFRSEATPEHMHFETGQKVGAPIPYYHHRFVYISQEGTKAHFGSITLRVWSRMCDYFSNNTIQTDADADADADDEDTTTFREHFEEYTTLKATPANISAAFEKGVMKRSNELQTKAPLRRVTPAKKKATSNTNNRTTNKETTKPQQLEKEQDATVQDLEKQTTKPQQIDDKTLSNDTKRLATPHSAGVKKKKKSKETRDATPNPVEPKTSNDTKRPATPYPDASTLYLMFKISCFMQHTPCNERPPNCSEQSIQQ